MDEYSPDELRMIYEDIRARVNARYVSRTMFAGHLVAFLVTTMIIVLFARSGMLLGLPDNLINYGIAAWFIGICIHTVNWLLTEMRERAIQKELERFGLRSYERYFLEKQKRDNNQQERLVRLTNDGEIVDYYDDDLMQQDEHAG
jgi:hypothetical protein